jgi:hypothetical protein
MENENLNGWEVAGLVIVAVVVAVVLAHFVGIVDYFISSFN